ncbi:hypothetical protein TEA_006796 [Camellia sinensis var. sinensis]|uniref:FBD domain-containing protein n=1 Tax=Camellia sinensis var. sinensis TaxID=542762 RepID=A0A4S4EFJ5_CAMSN|nr:hypothetical protein TEA_006796 [Camellia sinensis var. sinensis]
MTCPNSSLSPSSLPNSSLPPSTPPPQPHHISCLLLLHDVSLPLSFSFAIVVIGFKEGESISKTKNELVMTIYEVLLHLNLKDYRRLLCLELHEVLITTNILSRLISGSPLLERLTVESSASFDHLEIAEAYHSRRTKQWECSTRFGMQTIGQRKEAMHDDGAKKVVTKEVIDFVRLLENEIDNFTITLVGFQVDSRHADRTNHDTRRLKDTPPKTISNMKRIMKKMRRSLSDIISNLPESVKETILACLSIQDAVRTSVLSTKWRYTWTKLPQLVFDDTFCSDLFCKTKDKLMTIIYQVLLFHHGPIPKFTCSLSGLKSCSEFDQLILFVSKKGIQELNLNIQNGELYKLPSSLFSCLQLKILTLHSCIFKSPPEFKGFSRLLKLELYEVVVTADILSRLISSSPLLERLSLQNSTSIDCLEINAPNLRFLLCEIHAGSICLKNAVQLASIAIDLMASMDVEEFEEAETSKLVTLFGNLPVIEFLELDYYYLRVHTDETADDVIDNPVLKLLEKQDWSDVSLNQLRAVEMYDISIMRSELEFIKLLLAKSPMLETMIIKPDPVEVADKGPTTNVITNMSAACVPKGLQPTMNNLKTLQFLEICFGQLNDISLILCLIRSSPNLEKITIQAYVDEETNAVDPVLELLEMQEWLDVSLNQLQTVDFWNLSGTSSELEFIKLLLVISPVLEVIFIEPDSKKIVDKGVRILKELAQFPRLSPKAEIEFDDPDED